MVFFGTFKLIIKNDIKNTGLRFIFVVQTNSIISRKELEYISTFVQDWSLCWGPFIYYVITCRGGGQGGSENANF